MFQPLLPTVFCMLIFHKIEFIILIPRRIYVKRRNINPYKRDIIIRFTLEENYSFWFASARNRRWRSDVDILVLIQNINDRYSLMNELRRELLPLNYAFDVIAITPEEFERDRYIPGTISRYASLEGEIIYEA